MDDDRVRASNTARLIANTIPTGLVGGKKF
jgi:hypothetical protein